MIKGLKQSQANIMVDQDRGRNGLGKAVGPLIQVLALIKEQRTENFRASVGGGRVNFKNYSRPRLYVQHAFLVKQSDKWVQRKPRIQKAWLNREVEGNKPNDNNGYFFVLGLIGNITMLFYNTLCCSDVLLKIG